MMDAIHAAYVAGIVDGEGSISLARSFTNRTRGRYVYPIVRIANTNKLLIDWLDDQQHIPWRSSRRYTSATNERCKPVHHLMWAVGPALGLIRDIQQYLVIKSEHAELALHLDALTKQAMADAGGRLGHGRPIPPWLLAKRLEIFERFVELNRRGVIHEPVI